MSGGGVEQAIYLMLVHTVKGIRTKSSTFPLVVVDAFRTLAGTGTIPAKK
jgi:hypothetical protein